MDNRFVYGNLNPEEVEINEIHRKLSDMAADIANKDERKDSYYAFRGASFQSNQTVKGTEGLCIEWDPDQRHLRLPRAEREELVRVMEQVGRDAIIEAVHRNVELFVGVIVGEARQGRDYFDLFNPDGTT